MYPCARKDRLLVERLADETLVYDLRRHKAHCLNETAAFVWDKCDGKTSVAQLARGLGNEFEASANEKIVWLALDRLQRAHLLQEREREQTQLRRYSRRQLVRKLGRMGVAIPVVMSIITPASAQTSLISPGQCAADPQGNAGRCCTNNRPCNPSNGKCVGATC